MVGHFWNFGENWKVANISTAVGARKLEIALVISEYWQWVDSVCLIDGLTEFRPSTSRWDLHMFHVVKMN